jgi:hypothetical protein
VKFFRQFCIALWFATVGLLTAHPALAAAPNGREVYRQECARCHGKNGEGVKNKYKEALYGDWSVEKLTRYIKKNMPEDDPDTLTVPESEAVSRFIHDTFYSREARARSKPPRIELVRLTNRQYVNTVADLLKRFGEQDPALGDERGLRGSYEPRRSLKDRTRINRVDRQISFDFGAGTPFDDQTTNAVPKTNEFSMTWRGSVIAEESGDYEFILKTPNGARLWVNDDDKAIIDASVASGDLVEHKATLRLIGGRAYPVRIECFKAPKDKATSVALLWKPPHGIEQLIPARNLSPVRVSPTFVLHTPFPPDDSSVGYERGVMISKAWDEAATHAAIEVANHVVKSIDRLSRSKPADTNRAAKVESFCADFVSAAFRRPLSTEETKVYVKSQFATAKPDDAVKRVVLLALKSPRFLYLGLNNSKPDDYEVATRLSFGLWDSLPDAQLMKRAGQGALHTREQAAEQAKRMLADPRARSKMLYFLQQWVQMNHVEDLSKDQSLYPGFTPEVIADLRTSLNIFLEDVVWSPASDYRQLLTADQVFLNNRLAQFYGLSTNAVDEFVKVSFDAKQRSGVITHPYLLSAFAYAKSTSPIHRGVFLTRNIVGRTLKPPPMAVAFKESDFAPNLTMREKISELTRPQACQGCHSVINPLGFSLEHFDAVGKYRTRENGKPIDAVSEYITDEGTSVKLTGARDVAQFAVNSEHAQNGFVEQLFHSVVKQPMLAYGADVPDRLRKSFVASGFNIQKLLTEIAVTSALHGTKPTAESAKKGKS